MVDKLLQGERKKHEKHLKQWFDEMCRMHISFCICSIIHNNRHITYMIYVDLSYVCRLPTLENFPKVPYRSGQSGRLLKSEAKKAARIPMILGHCHPWGWWLRMLPVVVWSSTIRLNGHPVLNSSVYGDDKDLLCGCMCCLLPHLLHRFNRRKKNRSGRCGVTVHLSMHPFGTNSGIHLVFHLYLFTYWLWKSKCALRFSSISEKRTPIKCDRHNTKNSLHLHSIIT